MRLIAWTLWVWVNHRDIVRRREERAMRQDAIFGFWRALERIDPDLAARVGADLVRATAATR